MKDSNLSATGEPDSCHTRIPPTDAELLLLFARNQDEQAFRRLVEKHAALVMGVCRQILRCDSDIEDAFQATFIVLSKRADSIKTADSLASWLYRVAYRTAWHSAIRRVKRREAPLDEELITEDDVALQKIHEQECYKILHEELNRLPERYQAPIILFHLQDRSREETANELELTDATVKARLARGRKMLRLRLARRGIGVSAAMGVAASLCQNAQASTHTTQLIEQCCLGNTGASSALPFSEGSELLAKQEIQRMIVSSASRPMFTCGVIAATVTMMFISWHGVSSAGQNESDGREASLKVSTHTAETSSDVFVATLAPTNKVEEKSTSGAAQASSDQSVTGHFVSQLALGATAKEDAPSQPTKDVSRKIRPGDIIAIWVSNSLPDAPIRGRYRVESTGKIALGPVFGRVKVDGVNIEEVEGIIQAHLLQYLQDPSVVATHDQLPGEASQASNPISSADDSLNPGELLRIRIGLPYQRPAYDELVEIESDGMLPVGFLFKRIDTKGKKLTQLEAKIKSVMGDREILAGSPLVLITRVKGVDRGHSDVTSELDNLRNKVDEIYRRVR